MACQIPCLMTWHQLKLFIVASIVAHQTIFTDIMSLSRVLASVFKLVPTYTLLNVVIICHHAILNAATRRALVV